MPEPSPAPPPRPVLVTDFDGTMTRRDFYRLVIEHRLPPGTPYFWGEYLAGRITHFEALRATFAAAEPGERELVELIDRMEPDPDLAAEVAALRAAGWDVVIASAGCRWYIDRILAGLGLADVPLHSNPGRVEGGRLDMEWPPADAPDYSPDAGIDKAAIVRAACARGGPVAFAGDGLTDVSPARLVPPRLRFARGGLAEALAARDEPFRPFERWAEVARALRAEPLP